MANPFLILDSVDVRRAEVAGSGRPLILQKFVIPPVRFKTMTRSAGGGVVDIDYMQKKVQPLEPAFMVFGIDRDVMPNLRDRWTFAAAMRDRKTNKAVAVRCEIEGAIVEWTPDEIDPGAFNGCNHLIKEVTHFELSIDGQEIWYIDEDEREIRQNGASLMADVRRALGA